MSTNGVDVQGHVEDGWGKVADAFRANFDGTPGETGASCAVYVGGRPVVDLWGGLADSAIGRAWDEDTIALVASTTKGAAAICAHLLVQRGELDLNAPVVQYWPEFGANGKDRIPVWMLLSHQAGLPLVDASLTFEDAAAWDPVIRALEAQEPLWEPGTEHVYHSITFGYLVGELVRRVSGRSIGRFFADEVADPLGLHAWIGLPESQEPNVARIDMGPLDLEQLTAGVIESTGLDEDTVTRWFQAVWGEGSVQARAGSLGGAFDNGVELQDTRAYRAAEIPAGNMLTNARSVARMYAATVSEVDGIRLLDEATLARAIEVQTDRTRMHGLPADLDLPADRSFYMSLGFWRSCPPLPMVGPSSFGHPGSGGSIGFGDPDAEVGFGYVMNRYSYQVGERRALNLSDAVVACLG